MSKRSRDRRDDRRSEAYGGVRETPRTRDAVRSVTTRAADTRSPLDAIGGGFFKPDLSAWETPIGGSSVFGDNRMPVNRAMAKAAKPAVRSELVSPAKRPKVATARQPEKVRPSRAAQQAQKSIAEGSTSLGRRLTGQLSRLSPTPALDVSRGKADAYLRGNGNHYLRGKGNHYPAVQPQTNPRLSEQSIGRAADGRKAVREHAQHSPPVRDPQTASTCKPRPQDNRPKRSGGGSSREFVPWCDRTRRR